MRCFHKKEKRPRQVGRFVARLGAGVLGCVLFYGLLVLVLGSIVMQGDPPTQKGIRIAVCGTETHTDLVLPARTTISDTEIDWPAVLPPPAYTSQPANFVTIGWGQKEFFLSTPTWGDLRLATALRAMVGAPSVLRIYYESALPSQSPWCRHMVISPVRYGDLARYIRREILADSVGRAIPVAPPTAGDQDVVFYEGRSLFHAFKTCNTWVLGGVKTAGLPAPLWTPLAYFIFRHLP